MGTGLVVELDLSLLELPLARLKADLVESFYGIRNVGLNVHGCVHYSIGSNTEDSSQLETASKNLA